MDQGCGLRIGLGFIFIYRRAMRRNSGYTNSASCSRAAWSPLVTAAPGSQ